MSDLQPSLFAALEPIRPIAPIKGETIQERFERFHAQNPHVYRRLVEICLTMKRRGLRQWGAKAAYEILRFQGILSTNGDAFKLPNSYTSRYARKIMAEVPELDGFFETRELRAD